MPANLAHELGTGRTLDNACREQQELARTIAVVDALAGRLRTPTAEVTTEERVAA